MMTVFVGFFVLFVGASIISCALGQKTTDDANEQIQFYSFRIAILIAILSFYTILFLSPAVIDTMYKGGGQWIEQLMKP